SQRGFVQRKEFDGAAFVVARIFFLEAHSDGFHRGLRLGDTDLRFQAADDGRTTEAPVIFDLLDLPGKHVVAHGDWDPEYVRTPERDDAFETRGRDAHDRIGRAVQGDRLADVLLVGAESPRPQAVTQNHFGVAADLLVSIGDECAAAIGLHAQHA